MGITARYFGLKKSSLFLWVVSGHLLLVWISKRFLINEIVFYNTYSDQLTYDRIIDLFDRIESYAWLGYAFVPISLSIKFLLISVAVYIGMFFLDSNNTVSFEKIFGVVIASEIVFFIAGLIKFLWFYLFAGNYDLNDLSFFYPLSLSNFFTYSEVDRIWIFPLQTLNLFQVAYIIILSFGLNQQSGIDMATAEKTVLVSYVPGLILVISLIMFLTIGNTA